MEVLCASRMLGTFTLDLLMICATVTSKENKKLTAVKVIGLTLPIFHCLRSEIMPQDMLFSSLLTE